RAAPGGWRSCRAGPAAGSWVWTRRRCLLDGLADFFVQQLIERVAQPAELLRSHERGLPWMRLIHLDDFLDAARPRREHRHAVGEEHRFAERMGHEYDGLLGCGQQTANVFVEYPPGSCV